MKMSLIKPSLCPPDGFRYVFPNDGYLALDWTHGAWVDNARNHLGANNMKIPDDLAGDMEDQLCQSLPPGWCNYDRPDRPRPSINMTWDDVKHGVATFASWIGSGMKFVPQAEAERRAAVCAKCYLNLPVHGCTGCHAAVATVVNHKHTQADQFLKACGVCKCLLRAKVHFPLSLLDRNRSKDQPLYPDHCWLNKDGPNFSHVPD